MFGLPMEVTVGLLSGVGGFVMKLMAQKQADNIALMKMAIEQRQHQSDLADAAAKRSSPWLRKFAAIIIILVAFVGLFAVAWSPNVDVSMVQDVPQKSFLWGLMKWGKTTEIITAQGFVIPDWFRLAVVSVVFFLFGTGAAKTSR